MGQEHPTVVGCPGQHRGIIRAEKTDVLYSNEVEIANAPHKSSHDPAVEVLVGEEPDCHRASNRARNPSGGNSLSARAWTSTPSRVLSSR